MFITVRKYMHTFVYYVFTFLYYYVLAIYIHIFRGHHVSKYFPCINEKLISFANCIDGIYPFRWMGSRVISNSWPRREHIIIDLCHELVFCRLLWLVNHIPLTRECNPIGLKSVRNQVLISVTQNHPWLVLVNVYEHWI